MQARLNSPHLGQRPDASYGFSIGGSGAIAFTDEQVRSEIRAFLSEIDPRTGYLAE
ncbi:MAG: hypothetical protein K0R99_4897 [Microbacterium sp.]|nr:hypothetical protein [Microbacterium sp.]